MVVGVSLGLRVSATTRQGINFAVSRHSIPLSVKALDFLHRDAHYRLLARQITEGLTSDEERVLAVFDWTRRTIQPTPEGWPVVDDHILNIIIRGHGLGDQMTDVFCTLSTYAGVPAFWRSIRDVPNGSSNLLSFAKVEGTWRVFDVVEGAVFRDASGQLVPVEALVAAPALADRFHEVPVEFSYAAYFERLHPFTIPEPLRAEQQMLGPRLLFETRKALHLIKTEGR